MNANKAREFFSSYFEGTLEKGLAQTLERRLNSDPELQAEYRSFEETMRQLGGLNEVYAEIPFDLDEKISARLDRHVYEQKRAATAPLLAWWKTIAVASLGALVLFGTIRTMGPGGDVTESGLSGLPTSGLNQLTASLEGDELKLTYRSSGEQIVTVRDVADGKVRDSFTLSPGKAQTFALTNSSDESNLVSIEIQGQTLPTLVAMPGNRPQLSPSGEGSLQDGALALATHFRMPIVLITKNPLRTVTWNLSSTEPVSGVREALGEGFEVELRDTGFLWITEH